MDRPKITPEILRHPSPPQEVIDLWFHRARAGGYIAFASRRNDAPRYFTIFPVHKRQLYFPHVLAHQLEETKYVGVNTYRQSALHKYRQENAMVPPETYTTKLARGEPHYFHAGSHHVRELTSILLDLDVGKDRGRISAEDAVVTLIARAVYGDIPYPSMVAFSGRGAYALWLLSEGGANDPPPLVNTENVHRWKLVASKLLTHADADGLYPDERVSRNLSQWCKAPGTIDTKTGRSVDYICFHRGNTATGQSNLPLYSLSALMDFFDVTTADDDRKPDPSDFRKYINLPAPSQPESLRKKKPKHGTPHRAQAPMRARYRDIEALATERRGFRVGQREKACTYYFWAVWSSYAVIHPWPDNYQRARERLYEFNRTQCKPSLPLSEIAKILKASYRPKARHQTILKALSITAREAEELDLRNLVPAEVRDRRKADQARKRKGREDRTAKVHRLIREGKTNREIKKLTRGDHPPVEPWTLCRARKELNVPDPARKPPGQAPLVSEGTVIYRPEN